jgi:hypothetical protein
MHCVVGEAVICELVSDREFPEKAGKNREFGGKRADFMKTGRQSRNDLNALRLNFPTQTIREFFEASRETGNYF